MMKLKLLLLVALLCCGSNTADDSGDKDERTLSVTVNPDCTKQLDEGQCKDLTMVHVTAKAKGSSNTHTLHYIWDFTGFPSILVAKTDRNASLVIAWNMFMEGKPNSISFSSNPEYLISSVIGRIMLFEDSRDIGDVNDDSVKQVTSLSPYDFSWKRENLTATEDKVVLFMKTNTVPNDTITESSFAIKVS